MSGRLVRFWGTRGSIPAPGLETARYGGNTSCVEVRCAGRVIVCDCGTGIRALGENLSREFKDRTLDADIFVGHTHWDHIQGFPFFSPAYRKDNRLRIHSAQGVGWSFEKIFRDQMGQNYFPVEVADMAARLDFRPVSGPLRVGEVEVRTTFTNHPGVNMAFRFIHDGHSVVYLTDHENHRAQAPEAGEFADAQDRLIADFCRGADLLVCDAQYDDEEYRVKRGWGHGRWRDALALGLSAGVRRLALFHHEPTRTDAALDSVVEQCRREAGSRLEVFAAQEKQEVPF